MSFENIPPDSTHKKKEKSRSEEEIDDIYLINSLFTEEDRKIIQIGLRELAKYLSSSKRNLPKVIVFPETSARPLAFAVRPILKKVYSEKEEKLPQLVFMKAYKEVGALKDFDEGEISENFFPYVEKLKEKKKIMQERAKEIIQKVKIDDFSRMLIIDDFASKKRMTIKVIRQAFQDALKILYPKKEKIYSDIPAFVFFSKLDQPKENIDQPKDNIFVGSFVESKPYDLKLSFTYRDSLIKEPSIGIEKITEEVEDKERLYVKKSKKAFPMLMRILRKEMRKMGEEEVKKI